MVRLRTFSPFIFILPAILLGVHPAFAQAESPTGRPYTFRVGVATSLAFGTEPSGFAPSFTLVGLGVKWSSGQLGLSLTGEMRLDLPTKTPIPDPAKDPSTLIGWGVYGTLVPCGHWSLLSLCGVMQLESVSFQFHIEANGGINSPTSTQLWPSIGGRLGVEIPLPPVPQLAVRIFGEVLGSLQQVGYRVLYGPSWLSPPFTEAIGAGFVLSL